MFLNVQCVKKIAVSLIISEPGLVIGKYLHILFSTMFEKCTVDMCEQYGKREKMF